MKMRRVRTALLSGFLWFHVFLLKRLDQNHNFPKSRGYEVLENFFFSVLPDLGRFAPISFDRSRLGKGSKPVFELGRLLAGRGGGMERPFHRKPGAIHLLRTEFHAGHLAADGCACLGVLRGSGIFQSSRRITMVAAAGSAAVRRPACSGYQGELIPR